MNASGRRNRTKFRDSFIKPLLEEGFLVLTIPGKPRSRMQRYKTTEVGRALHLLRTDPQTANNRRKE